MQISLLSPAIGTGNIGDFFIEQAVRRLLHSSVAYRTFTTRRTLTDAEIESINRSDCALLCGTSLYQRGWESALTPAILGRIQVPVIPLGVGSSAASLDEQQVGRKT